MVILIRLEPIQPIEVAYEMQTWNFLLNLKMAIFEIQGWYGCQFLVAMFDPIIEPSSRISATIPERASARQRWYSQANLFRCFDFLTKIVKCVTDLAMKKARKRTLILVKYCKQRLFIDQ